MSLAWKPRAELPQFAEPTNILIAWPATAPDEIHFLGGIYCVCGREVRHEDHNTPPPSDGWYWVTEDEVLAGLPGTNFSTTTEGATP